MEYFNNYLKDPKRPQLPEHPGSRAQKREHPGDREGFGGGGGGFMPQWVVLKCSCVRLETIFFSIGAMEAVVVAAATTTTGAGALGAVDSTVNPIVMLTQDRPEGTLTTVGAATGKLKFILSAQKVWRDMDRDRVCRVPPPHVEDNSVRRPVIEYQDLDFHEDKEFFWISSNFIYIDDFLNCKERMTTPPSQLLGLLACILCEMMRQLGSVWLQRGRIPSHRQLQRFGCSSWTRRILTSFMLHCFSLFIHDRHS